MFKVLAQEGTTQLHLEGANKHRTLRVSSTEPLEALAITVAVEDVPGIALGLLKGNPHLLTDPHLSTAVKVLAVYVAEQKAKQEKTRLRERQDALAERFTGNEGTLYGQCLYATKKAISAYIELEDRLEAAK